MKIVKKYSRLSIPMYLPYGKVMVSPRYVYVYDYCIGRFMRYSHTEFYKYWVFARADFSMFLKDFFDYENR